MKLTIDLDIPEEYVGNYASIERGRDIEAIIAQYQFACSYNPTADQVSVAASGSSQLRNLSDLVEELVDLENQWNSTKMELEANL